MDGCRRDELESTKQNVAISVTLRESEHACPLKKPAQGLRKLLPALHRRLETVWSPDLESVRYTRFLSLKQAEAISRVAQMIYGMYTSNVFKDDHPWV